MGRGNSDGVDKSLDRTRDDGWPIWSAMTWKGIEGRKPVMLFSLATEPKA